MDTSVKLFLKSLALLGLVLALLAPPAFADTPVAAGQTVTVQTAPPSPVGAPAAAGATTTTITTAPPAVSIPWGDWLDAAINQVVIPLLGVVVLSLLTIAGARIAPLLPSWLQGFVNTKNTAALEQLIVPALATGLKSVGSSVDGKAIAVPVQSAAVATAADYAVAHGSAALVKWAGGPDGIRQKIEARLAMLTTGVTASATTTLPTTTTVTTTQQP